MVRHWFAIVCVVVGVSVAFAAGPTVSQKGRLFSPGAITVKTGETVLFRNDDSVTHHIYSSTKGHEFDLETARAGQDAKRVFAKPGRVEVRCGLHPGMRLVVTVK